MATHPANRGALRPLHVLATASVLTVMLLPGMPRMGSPPCACGPYYIPPYTPQTGGLWLC